MNTPLRSLEAFVPIHLCYLCINLIAALEFPFNNMMGITPLTRYDSTGELGYDGPLYDRFLHMTDDMLGPSPMHIKYSSYVYDGFCI